MTAANPEKTISTDPAKKKGFGPDKIRDAWKKFSKFPGGKFLFSKFVGRIIPYTGSIGAQVVDFDPGHVKVLLTDRRAVRNHLQSIHAIALANLAEFTSGLAMYSRLDGGARGILKGFQIEYLKKARGDLTGHSVCPPIPALTESIDFEVLVDIKDRDQNIVAKAKALWRLGPG